MYFLTFQKKLKAQKTQAEKKLKQIFEKLNNLSTKNWFFAQKFAQTQVVILNEA